jgi:hypothetical protein
MLSRALSHLSISPTTISSRRSSQQALVSQSAFQVPTQLTQHHWQQQLGDGALSGQVQNSPSLDTSVGHFHWTIGRFRSCIVVSPKREFLNIMHNESSQSTDAVLIVRSRDAQSHSTSFPANFPRIYLRRKLLEARPNCSTHNPRCLSACRPPREAVFQNTVFQTLLPAIPAQGLGRGPALLLI